MHSCEAFSDRTSFKANVIRKQSVVCSEFLEHNLHCGDEVIKIMLTHFHRHSSILFFPPVALSLLFLILFTSHRIVAIYCSFSSLLSRLKD